MGDDNSLADYRVIDADGVERQYQLTADEAKARGGTAVDAAAKGRTPANKAVTPDNKSKG